MKFYTYADEQQHDGTYAVVRFTHVNSYSSSPSSVSKEILLKGFTREYANLLGYMFTSNEEELKYMVRGRADDERLFSIAKSVMRRIKTLAVANPSFAECNVHPLVY